MTEPEVTFADVELDERQRADVRGVLRRIRSDSGPGAWPSQVDHIRVTGVLAGGQSGALVLGIDVHHGSQPLAWVAKIDSPATLIAEWQSYDRLIRPNPNIFFAPIVAATPDVVTQTVPDGGPGAVVYAHAAQYAGRPDMPLCTLEDLVRAALGGSTAALDRALRMIELLLCGAAHVLYHKHQPDTGPSTLRSMNLSLGPNVVLSVDGRDPAHGGPARLPDDELLARTIGGAAPAQLVPGADVELNHLHPDPAGRPWIARGDNIIVAIEPVADQSAGLTGQPEFAVHGRVVETRGSATRSRMLGALAETGPVDLADDGWVVAGTEVANPFAVLLDVLTRSAERRVRSVVHGDLNPRNALVVEDQPFLIDYSHTDFGPQQADFCWLELGLVRDVFADLGFPALVVLQRWLALASRVLDDARDADAVSVMTTLVGRQAPDLAVPFRMLLAIRRCGRRIHPEWSSVPWRHDHLEQLLLAAHRSAKWTHAVQTPARLRATVAVASVATEHLGAGNGFVRWTDVDLAAALAAVEPILSFADDDPVQLVRELAAAVSTVDGPTEAVLAVARERLVRTRCVDQARRLLAERAGHDEYIDLTATPSAAPDGVDVFALIAAEPAIVMCGAFGSGKSTVLREAAYRLAVAVLDTPAFDADDPGSLSVRVPVLVDAVSLARLCSGEDDPVAVARAVLADVGLADVTVAALELGAPYLLVDNLDQLGFAERRSVLAWLSELRQRYSLVRVLACQRQPDASTEFAPFTLRLRDLDVAGMR
ncbi:MAG TPA: hypothetical protein VH333_16870, partial [Pseudonocardiaceae bacterium]|nr:hypothetical protein [Pseudonocardiaceae bacterium]